MSDISPTPTTGGASSQPTHSEAASASSTSPSPTSQRTPAASPVPQSNSDLATFLDQHAIEHMVALKVRRFLDQVGAFYPENLYHLMMRKMEKPLITEVLKRTGGNQLQASKILGINRLTLAKKIKLYNLSSPPSS